MHAPIKTELIRVKFQKTRRTGLSGKLEVEDQAYTYYSLTILDLIVPSIVNVNNRKLFCNKFFSYTNYKAISRRSWYHNHLYNLAWGFRTFSQIKFAYVLICRKQTLCHCAVVDCRRNVNRATPFSAILYISSRALSKKLNSAPKLPE